MSSLIRFRSLADAVAIRPLNTTAASQLAEGESADPMGLFARDPELVRRDQEIAALREALDQAREQQAQAITTAREDGKREAEAAYRRKDEEMLQALKTALVSAQKEMEERLTAAKSLALLLAEAALAKVFVKPKNQRDLVTRAIERQVETLRSETIVRFHVSGGDFPDQAALDALAKSVAQGRFEARRDPQLASGASRIDLRLGHIELSLSQHWEALKALFRRLAEPEGAA